MRKLLLVNIAVAALATGALMSDRADATTLGAAAGLSSAAEGAGQIEQVGYWGWRRHHRRHHAFYGERFRAPYRRADNDNIEFNPEQSLSRFVGAT